MTNEMGSPPAPKGFGGGMRRLALGAAFALTFAAGAVVSGGTLAAAQAMHGGGMHGGGMPGMEAMHAMAGKHLEQMMTAVDATPDQKARIHAVLQGAMA